MAGATVAFVMGLVEPHVEEWSDVLGGITANSMVPPEWQSQEQSDSDDIELKFGWINPQTLMQEDASDMLMTACPDVAASQSSLSCLVETQWLDTSSYINQIEGGTVAIVPDDFMVTCHQAADQSNSSEQWLEDLDDVDLFLQQLECEQGGSNSNTVVIPNTTGKTDESISCSQLELMLRSNDAPPNSATCSEVDTDVDIENNTNDSLPDYTDSDDASDDSDWSYSGKKHRRRSTGRKRAASHLKAYSQVTCISSSSLNIRKKEQNKNAATRYRERKRTEEQDNEAECLALEKRNKELRIRVSEMTHEVTVLRQLIVDIFRTSPA